MDWMPPADVEPKPGQFLLSEPFLDDPWFGRKVVFLCDHDEQGSLGFVLNTPEEAERQERLLKPAYLEYAKKFDSNVWVRPYANDPKRAFAQRRLDPHTLLEAPPPDAIDPALLEDPLADA